jgi:hypothetical protein
MAVSSPIGLDEARRVLLRQRKNTLAEYMA